MRKRSCSSSLPDPVAREIITHHPAVARRVGEVAGHGRPARQESFDHRAIVELGLTLLAEQ